MGREEDVNVEHELRTVLSRSMSGRSDDTTFDAPEFDTEVGKKCDIKGGCEASSKPEPTMKEILEKAGKRALGGGLPGAMAMGIQVGSLMWLRTTMNYQYRYGTSTKVALQTLYKEGGIRRFYRGVGPALIQGPMSRFGDTAANAGMLSLLNSQESTRDLPVAAKTACASFAAGLWRVFLMPVDTLKTVLQVEGTKGPGVLKNKIKSGGPFVMYHGAVGAAGATMVGHYPWFFTFNTLQEKIPMPGEDEVGKKLARNALIGFCSSFVSDCTSNSIRVIKTTKQTSRETISYPQAVKLVIEKDGVSGLFIRGLQTRIIANGFQGMLFTVLWKYMEETFFNKNN
uniref:Mitochondrial carrier protein n=1 Tax=Mucochytrium quahogii TaxID=96639 RepID=A0A7S2WCX6_9STRA|mmetsp:Transcript_14051/g.22960  ORF Transcript_14051/g.22960 Transcript_14051/m.22960 type:complete len:342 (-) Transcript_14051:27-1052(-)|eukprot:CAMPEP_0203774418 /NCGR_PEP_ID=MMETSP0099_2-20121227/5323_1 /ASSEMBLY_ACC=CAM_ASM_000209 /TAXON_ID=96639 /ORGANISM=" , Strain NY0313808BC1" /LENGTH=341 /DNA_ID=CAMNT_0050672599 /DNA_START=453 /DNA_END=1478 /DNA_ORIENTATION=-